jgi:hypothetical protein
MVSSRIEKLEKLRLAPLKPKIKYASDLDLNLNLDWGL